MSKGNRAAVNNRANQMNPNNSAYGSSRAGTGHSKPALDNRSNQLNPNHADTKAPVTEPSGSTPAKGGQGDADK